MKWWLHIVAAVAGLALAALIVFLVFGSASEQGATQEGSPASAAGSSCTTVAPGTGAAPASREKARESLPNVVDDEQRSVTPRAGEQREWFVALQAASGLCATDVTVLARELQVNLSYPATTSDDNIEAYAYAVLARSFAPPLARTQVRLEIQQGRRTRKAFVTSEAWANFQRGRSALGLEPTIQGLRSFRTQVGYGPQRLQFTNW